MDKSVNKSVRTMADAIQGHLLAKFHAVADKAVRLALDNQNSGLLPHRHHIKPS